MGIEQLSTIWPEWSIVEQIGEGSFGKVYKVMREEHGFTDYAAVKVITIPKSKAELNALRSDGYDEPSSRSYLESKVNVFVNEIKLMVSMKGTANIVSVEDYKVVERVGEIGWDIFIRMELLTSFIDYTAEKKLTETEVIKLGLDVCSALELCARKNIIHRDIKPENLFVSSFGDFKVGDFGVARELEKSGGSMSMTSVGTYNYIAPEIRTAKQYDATVDIYSLGLVLYRLMNNNRLPFLDPNAQMIDYRDHEDASDRRLRGENLPAPVKASLQMAHAIIKACLFDPAMRYKTATEMKSALEAVKNGTYDMLPYDLGHLYQPPNQSGLDETIVSRRVPDGVSCGLNETALARRVPEAPKNPVNSNTNNNKSKSPLPTINAAIISGVAIVCVIILAFIVFRVMDIRSCDTVIRPPDPPQGNDGQSPTPTPTPEPTPTPTPDNDSEPEQTPTESQIELGNEILSTSNWVLLELNWDNGESTLFERNRNSTVWTMESRTGSSRLVDPDFLLEGNEFSMGFPTTNNRYYFYDDDTAIYGSPAGSRNDYLTWTYKTDMEYDNGSSFGANQTIDIYDAIIRYPYVSLHVHWDNDHITIFYKQRDGQWRMKSRSETGLTNVDPVFSAEYDYTYLTFSSGATPYILHNDGTGWRNDEPFTWSYNYSS